MAIDQKLQERIKTWITKHPGEQCDVTNGKPELVAEFQRHYGSSKTTKAIDTQIKDLLRKHRGSICPQRTRAGLSVRNVGDPTSHAPSEMKKSNNKNNPKNGPVYRKRAKEAKQTRWLGCPFNEFRKLSLEDQQQALRVLT
jgi:hypothetical protein